MIGQRKNTSVCEVGQAKKILMVRAAYWRDVETMDISQTRMVIIYN